MRIPKMLSTQWVKAEQLKNLLQQPSIISFRKSDVSGWLLPALYFKEIGA